MNEFITYVSPIPHQISLDTAAAFTEADDEKTHVVCRPVTVEARTSRQLIFFLQKGWELALPADHLQTQQGMRRTLDFKLRVRLVNLHWLAIMWRGLFRR